MIKINSTDSIPMHNILNTDKRGVKLHSNISPRVKVEELSKYGSSSSKLTERCKTRIKLNGETKTNKIYQIVKEKNSGKLKDNDSTETHITK